MDSLKAVSTTKLGKVMSEVRKFLNSFSEDEQRRFFEKKYVFPQTVPLDTLIVVLTDSLKKSLDKGYNFLIEIEIQKRCTREIF